MVSFQTGYISKDVIFIQIEDDALCHDRMAKKTPCSLWVSSLSSLWSFRGNQSLLRLLSARHNEENGYSDFLLMPKPTLRRVGRLERNFFSPSRSQKLFSRI